MKDGRRGYVTSNRKNGRNDNDNYFFVNNRPRNFNCRIRIIDSVERSPLGGEISVSTVNGTFGKTVDSGGYFRTRIKAEKEITVNAS